MLKPATNLQSLADQLLLQKFPRCRIGQRQGRYPLYQREQGNIWSPRPAANWNIFAMAREGLRFDLGSAFQKGPRTKRNGYPKGLTIGENAGTAYRRYHCQVHSGTGSRCGNGHDCIYDGETSRKEKEGWRKDRACRTCEVLELEQELDICAKKLQTTREEMQSSQEELNQPMKNCIHERGAAVYQ